MSKKGRVYKWFIEPLNTHTNEIIARNQEFLSDEHVIDGVKCADGRFHRLWGCVNYDFVAKLYKSRTHLGAIFKIWHQEGHGKIRLWGFPQKKPKRAPVEK